MKTEERMRLNLYLEQELFQVIQSNAKSNYLKTGTYVKQFLNRHFMSNNEIDVKPFKHEKV